MGTFKTTTQSVGFFNYYCSMVSTWCSRVLDDHIAKPRHKARSQLKTTAKSVGLLWASLNDSTKRGASLIIIVLWYPPDVPDPGWPCRKAAEQSPPRPSWTPRSHQLNREKRTKICFKEDFWNLLLLLYDCRSPQFCGSGMFFPDSGSEFFPSRIQAQKDSRIPDSDQRI